MRVALYLVTPLKSIILTLQCMRPSTAEHKTANVQKYSRKKSTVSALVFCDKSEAFPFPITRDTMFEKILYRYNTLAFGTIYVFMFYNTLCAADRAPSADLDLLSESTIAIFITSSIRYYFAFCV